MTSTGPNSYLTLLFTGFRLGGGVLKSFAKFLNILQKEGIYGIKRRIAYLKTGIMLPPQIDTNRHNNYELWIRLYEKKDGYKDDSSSCSCSISYRPMISIVMPVYRPPLDLLNNAIMSVRNQIYENWELCICDDHSCDSQIKDLLITHSNRDSRIKLFFLEQNRHISEATNCALKLASGQYIGFLDHDDMLSADALYEVAECVNAHPRAGIFYSDEDKIDSTGFRFAPHFKTDWNPDLFFSMNYVCHFCIYRSDLIGKVGGLRHGFEGSQDYDLTLRCLKHLADDQIIHIPKVLYHWRAARGSVAFSPLEKSYSQAAGLKALQEFFDDKSSKVVVREGPVHNSYRLLHPIPDPPPLVSIIVPTRDGVHLLRQCLHSVTSKTSYSNYEVIIVNNQSTDTGLFSYLDSIAQQENMTVLTYDLPFNYSAINNFAVKRANGDIIALINNDVSVISPGWLTEMVSHACRPDIGCVGAKLYYEDGLVQHAGVILGLRGVAGHSHRFAASDSSGYFSRLKLVQNISAVTAACLVVRKNVYEAVGGFDETNLAVAFNDVDFCLRVAEAGLRNLWTPFAEMYHLESKSRGIPDDKDDQHRMNSEIKYMIETWGHLMHKDPYYNPNLTLEREDFSLAWPPRASSKEESSIGAHRDQE